MKNGAIYTVQYTGNLALSSDKNAMQWTIDMSKYANYQQCDAVQLSVQVSTSAITSSDVLTADKLQATCSTALQETVPVTIISGYKCNYTVGQDIGVIAESSYAISEEIPVEYGKTYITDYISADSGFAFYFVGYNNVSGKVTESIKVLPKASGTFTAEWTPTVETTNRLRLRGYANNLPNAGITELTVS